MVNSDRPIKEISEDLLNRKPFVYSIISSL
jgi:hypothetical protein